MPAKTKLLALLLIPLLVLSACARPAQPAADHTETAGALHPDPAAAGEIIFAGQAEAGARLEISALPTAPSPAYSLLAIYDEAHMLAYRCDADGRRLGLGLYELMPGIYEEIYTNDSPEYAFSVIGFLDNTVFLERSRDNWASRDVYKLDCATGGTTPVLTDAPYDRFWDHATVFLDNSFYFDNPATDETGAPASLLYSYDLARGELRIAQEQCQNPLLYQGRLIAFFPDASGKYRVLGSMDASWQIELDFSLAEIAATPERLFVIENQYKSPDQPPYKLLRDLTRGKDIYATAEMIYDLQAAGNFLSWVNYNSGAPAQPMLYDLETEELLLFSHPAYQGICSFYLYETYGILSVVHADGGNDLYRFRRQDENRR